MATKWTEQQLAAMEPCDRLTVLSAAAGSGKTTVLVERAINLLLDEENPVSADKMLIVTFSNASAAEFRKRIEKGINRKIKENPQNNFIKMQKVALQKADISTIHAFCIKLVRENFQLLDISPDFSICDDAQKNELHRKAISMAMDYGYTLPDFKELVSFYGKSSTDREIRDFLKQMHHFFSAIPHPQKVAGYMAHLYSSEEMEDSLAFCRLTENLALQADFLTTTAAKISHLYDCSSFTGYGDGIAYVNVYAADIQKAIERKDITALKQLLSGKAPTLGKAKPACAESKTINEVIYKEFKAVLSDMKKTVEYMDKDAYNSNIQATDRYVAVLFDVFIRYQQILMEIKKEEKAFEFSDFEHFAFELLQDEDGKPTELALSLREQYEYIMEDEFQDTSYVQDAIFRMIARENESNLYVVGDVKQSIYSFRKASPDIFLQKRDTGIKTPDKGRTLYLPHNFRSSYSVIEGVNYIFSKIMSAQCGGVDYDKNEALMTLKQPDMQTGIKLNIYDGDEAMYTAREINKMIKSGYMIQDGDTMRPVKSGDFCILMRSSKNFRKYKAALEQLGYEAFVKDDELILNKPEIQTLITLLRVISNPSQEVYLTAAMFGDLFGFSLDEILKVRMINKKRNLYQALSLSDDNKAKAMLDTLKDLTYVSGVYSADKLIDYICKKTGYYSRLAFTEDGTQKRDNIRWFTDFARQWAKTHPSDLSAFIRWTDLYIENGKASAESRQKSDSAIAIMTMHTSKGLEFPVVFVTGLATKFNRIDTTKRLMLDTELGIGMYVNRKFGYNNSTLHIHAIKSKTAANLASEEMRLLYVAFTRSKNLLVLSAAYNRFFTHNTVGKTVECAMTKPHPALLQSMTTPAHWVISALAGHPYFAQNSVFGTEDKNIPQSISVEVFEPETEETQDKQETEEVSTGADLDLIRKNLSYVYPHLRRTKLPIKMSVSEIAKEKIASLSKPDFMKEGKATASEKGTAMHSFAQHADILLARTNLENQLEILEAEGLVNRSLLNIPAIEKFLYSDVADMITRSEKVYVEKDFLVPYPAYLAIDDPQYRQDSVLVQGVMDCVLENNGEITIIDYKTDRVQSTDILFDRYEKQLELYRYAAKQLFNTENVKCILYSFHLNEHIIF